MGVKKAAVKWAEPKEDYIAACGYICGVGTTLEAAYAELKEQENVEIEEVDFYRAVRLKVEAKLIEVQKPVEV